MVKKWYDVVFTLRQYGSSKVLSIAKEFVDHNKMVVNKTFEGKICIETGEEQ